jgi:hypothetical protein
MLEPSGSGDNFSIRSAPIAATTNIFISGEATHGSSVRESSRTEEISSFHSFRMPPLSHIPVMPEGTADDSDIEMLSTETELLSAETEESSEVEASSDVTRPSQSERSSEQDQTSQAEGNVEPERESGPVSRTGRAPEALS